MQILSIALRLVIDGQFSVYGKQCGTVRAAPEAQAGRISMAHIGPADDPAGHLCVSADAEPTPGSRLTKEGDARQSGQGNACLFRLHIWRNLK